MDKIIDQLNKFAEGQKRHSITYRKNGRAIEWQFKRQVKKYIGMVPMVHIKQGFYFIIFMF